MGNPERSESTRKTPPAIAAGPTHRKMAETFIHLSSVS
jgi:hypothetical protein